MSKSITQISVLMCVNVCWEPFHQCRKWLLRTFCIGRVYACDVSSSANVNHRERQRDVEKQRERERDLSTILIIQCDLTQWNRNDLTVLVCVGRRWKRRWWGGLWWLWHCIWSTSSTHSAWALCTTETVIKQCTVQRTHHVKPSFCR